VILFTCGQGGNRFDPHCGKARKALDAAGFEYEVRKVPGYRLLPWTWSKLRTGRAEVKALTGSYGVPVLVLDDGIPIAGTQQIVDWVKERSGG
jgi:glutathione S-transferase